VFFLNVGRLSADYTTFYPRRKNIRAFRTLPTTLLYARLEVLMAVVMNSDITEDITLQHNFINKILTGCCEHGNEMLGPLRWIISGVDELLVLMRLPLGVNCFQGETRLVTLHGPSTTDPI
jgi:hypothetical protein